MARVLVVVVWRRLLTLFAHGQKTDPVGLERLCYPWSPATWLWLLYEDKGIFTTQILLTELLE